MQPVWINAWRPLSCCLPKSSTRTEFLSLRRAIHILKRPSQREICARPRLPPGRDIIPQVAKKKRAQTSSKCFSTTPQSRSPEPSPFHQRLPDRAPSELAFRRNDLRPYEVKVVFGSDQSPPLPLANSLLKTLHSRRVNGTLDLDLPPQLTSKLTSYPNAVEDALAWLRREYPMDEDAAILQRIEREETGEGDEALINRAENLGLYKPQSGEFGAKLGKEGDIYGESILHKIRKLNALKAREEQKELDDFIEQKQKANEEKAGALEVRKEDGLEVSISRPPNVYEKWKMRHYIAATSKITLDEASQTPMVRRLLPALLFAAAVTYGSYQFALNWTPPERRNRLMPDRPLSQATMLGILAINLGIFILWKFPPAWRLLNRYFISTPGAPRPFSLLGSVFSHQSLGHLTSNMLLLLFLGGQVHEQIGRGNFTALYLSGGVAGSAASLIVAVARKRFHTSSLGASAAVIAVFAAFCQLKPGHQINFWFLPQEWREKFSFKRSDLLVLSISLELLSMVFPFLRSRPVDYVSHLGGYGVGIVVAWWLRGPKEADTPGPWGGSRSKERRWYENLLGR